MESRATRKALRAFPVDFEFTQDPKDDLRKFLDIPGRQAALASEYMRSQLDNLFIATADLNEPSQLLVSGVTIPLNVVVSGNVVQDLQDLASMEVTGFDYVDSTYPSGTTGGNVLGVSYVQDAVGSGYLYVSVEGTRTVYRYPWKFLDQLTSTSQFGTQTQNFDNQDEDEYLSIQRDGSLVTATLKNTPLNTVRVIDTKNLSAPWDPTSDGIQAPTMDITVSGNVLILRSPRPSYSPAFVETDGSTTYPEDYQPDQYWESSFIAEYDYAVKEAPYGLSQSEIRHEMGLPGEVLGASEDI